MKRARAHALAPACFSMAAAIAGCGAREIAVEIDFTPDSLADDASAIELHVVDRCADVIRGQVPPASLASVAFRRDEPPRGVPGALPEGFGVAVIARDDRCGIVGFGCLDASRGVSSLRIEVTSVTGSACEASARCDDGLCVAGDVPDASIDASTIDARVTPDANDLDADPDAWIPESACDCVDDDVDGRVDEGCSTEVLWQTPLDAVGQQAFRGAALGGDGRVYLNGWMDTAGADATLCARGPFRATGVDGPSYVVNFDATTGACESVLERVDGSAAPPSPFAFPQPGRRGMWLFAQTEIVEIVGATVVGSMTMNDTASFNIGDVLPRPDASDDLLVHYWANPAVATQLLGTSVGMLGSDPIALVSGGSVGSTHVPREVSTGWLGADRFFVVGPSAAAPGFPCSNGAEHPTSGPLRVEVRYADMMAWCERAVGLPTDPAGAREHTAVASGDLVWSLFLFEDRYVLTVADPRTGAVAERVIPSALTGTEADTVTHLVALSGGDVAMGGAVARVDGGMREREGVVMRMGFEDGAIVERTRRRVGDGVVGLGVARDRDVVYVTAHVDSAEPLCAGGLFVPDDTAVLVNAIDLATP